MLHGLRTPARPLLAINKPSAPPMDPVTALAESWASIDGKLEAFLREKALGTNLDHEAPTYTGHYLGYLAEAEEMIERLAARGFKIVRNT